MTPRVLYLPIFESGDNHAAAVREKRGLYNALAARGPVLEWDYLDNEPATRYQGMVNRIVQFQPTHILTQFHAANILSPEQIAQLKKDYPGVVWINWCGDSWNHSLIASDILALAHVYDLWLVAAPGVLPVYQTAGIHAAYWNIGYEASVVSLPDMPAYDVVFLGNVTNDDRRKLIEFLHGLKDIRVGIYGDWEHAIARNTYHFAEGEALYRNARIAIADNAAPDNKESISNRPIQITGAGGALLLHQRVPNMEALTGWRAGEHYIEWIDLDDLRDKIHFWLDLNVDWERYMIAQAAQAYTLGHHTFSARVTELFEELLISVKDGIE